MQPVETQIAAESQLTDAFTAFIGAANRLEDSHRQLHDQVAELRRQLEERNRALASSVAETERVRTMLRQILDALPCGVAVLDPRGEEIILLNPEGRRLFEATEPDGWQSLPLVVQTAVSNVCKSSWGHHYEQDIAVDTGTQKRYLAIRYSRMTACVVNNSAVSSFLVLIVSDVTARKTMEVEREHSRNVLALAEMATVLAHEIRNPLGSMELLTGCLAGDPALGEDSQRCVQHLRAGVRSLSATVNNVLCFHNQGALQVAPMELAPALKSGVEFIRPLAEQKGVNLVTREDLNNAEISGNSSGLRQILLNLACNALRHTVTGGEINIRAWVEVTQPGPMAIIEFADTGSGIQAKDIPHIFKMGFTTTGQTPGLGLTVCQRLVEQYRGTITARSKWRQGTTFRMEFPVL
jgi:two-component system sensor histidine kinase FlrB